MSRRLQAAKDCLGGLSRQVFVKRPEPKAEEAKAAKAAAKAFAEAEAEVEVGPALAMEEKERPNNLTDLLMNTVNPRWLFRK